jgi:hypothetical protein
MFIKESRDRANRRCFPYYNGIQQGRFGCMGPADEHDDFTRTSLSALLVALSLRGQKSVFESDFSVLKPVF